MIRVEDIENGMEVITKKGFGIVTNYWVSDGNRVYADVDLKDGGHHTDPIDRMTKLR